MFRKHLDKEEFPRDNRNKFLVAQIISKRARQLSERKGQSFLEEGNVNPIEKALRELEEGKLSYVLPSRKKAAIPEGGTHDDAGVEER